MRKNHIHGIIIHHAENTNTHALAERMSQFHADIIERRLRKSVLSIMQKIHIIDKITDSLKSREANGIINSTTIG